MKQVIHFILITICTVSHISSQNQQDETLLTSRENVAWLLELEKIDTKAEQLVAIKNKILSDSIYQLSNTNVYHTGFSEIKRKSIGSGREILKSNCECKVLFELHIKHNVYKLDVSEFEYTKQVLPLINDSNIKRIVIHNSEASSVFWGESAKCGAVVLLFKNWKSKKRIHKLLSSSFD